MIRYFFAMLVVMAAAGCAHPLKISPDISKIERDKADVQIEKNVAYYVAPEARDKTVTTPGGGGDSVAYAPYKDVEVAFYKMLGNVFKNVTLLKSPTDVQTITKNSIAYVITPEISTNSSSPSPFTWPPTKFTVDLTCRIADSNGKLLSSVSVTGEGQAEFSEFKSDYSLSGKRATEDALLKMQHKLLTMRELAQ
jgi:hypothetical protein